MTCQRPQTALLVECSAAPRRFACADASMLRSGAWIVRQREAARLSADGSGKGGDGIALGDFLAQPVSHWTAP